MIASVQNAVKKRGLWLHAGEAEGKTEKKRRINPPLLFNL